MTRRPACPRCIHPNKSAAESAVKARLAAFNRPGPGVRFEMPGRTDRFAERPINAQGFKVGLDGEYLADSVEQVYTQAGWSTTVEYNGGNKGKAKAKGKKKKEVKAVKVVNLGQCFCVPINPQRAVFLCLEFVCPSLSNSYNASCPTPAAKRAFLFLHSTPPWLTGKSIRKNVRLHSWPSWGTNPVNCSTSTSWAAISTWVSTTPAIWP